MGAAPAAVSPIKVAKEFTRVYYSVMAKLPTHLADFYGEASTFDHGDDLRASGRLEISALTSKLPMYAKAATLHSVTTQPIPNANGSIVVVVYGSYIDSEDKVPFSQTFVLAKHPDSHNEHFYCSNDVFTSLSANSTTSSSTTLADSNNNTTTTSATTSLPSAKTPAPAPSPTSVLASAPSAPDSVNVAAQNTTSQLSRAAGTKPVISSTVSTTASSTDPVNSVKQTSAAAKQSNAVVNATATSISVPVVNSNVATSAPVTAVKPMQKLAETSIPSAVAPSVAKPPTQPAVAKAVHHTVTSPAPAAIPSTPTVMTSATAGEIVPLAHSNASANVSAPKVEHSSIMPPTASQPRSSGPPIMKQSVPQNSTPNAKLGQKVQGHSAKDGSNKRLSSTGASHPQNNQTSGNATADNKQSTQVTTPAHQHQKSSGHAHQKQHAQAQQQRQIANATQQQTKRSAPPVRKTWASIVSSKEEIAGANMGNVAPRIEPVAVTTEVPPSSSSPSGNSSSGDNMKENSTVGMNNNDRSVVHHRSGNSPNRGMEKQGYQQQHHHHQSHHYQSQNGSPGRNGVVHNSQGPAATTNESSSGMAASPGGGGFSGSMNVGRGNGNAGNNNGGGRNHAHNGGNGGGVAGFNNGGHSGNSGSSGPRMFGPSAVVTLSSTGMGVSDVGRLRSHLRDEFGRYGHKLRGVEVKQSKGIAFIEYESAEGVRTAVEKWAHGPRQDGPFAGIALHVSEKRVNYTPRRTGPIRGGGSRSNRNRGGGGGGGGGGTAGNNNNNVSPSRGGGSANNGGAGGQTAVHNNSHHQQQHHHHHNHHHHQPPTTTTNNNNSSNAPVTAATTTMS